MVENLCGLGVRLYDDPYLNLFVLVDWDGALSSVRVSTDDLFCIRFPVVGIQGSQTVTQHVASVKPSSLLLHSIEM